MDKDKQRLEDKDKQGSEDKDSRDQRTRTSRDQRIRTHGEQFRKSELRQKEGYLKTMQKQYFYEQRRVDVLRSRTDVAHSTLCVSCTHTV